MDDRSLRDDLDWAESMTMTDVALSQRIKTALCAQVDLLASHLDGYPRPTGLRATVYLHADGRIRKVEASPVFEMEGAKR